MRIIPHTRSLRCSSYEAKRRGHQGCVAVDAGYRGNFRGCKRNILSSFLYFQRHLHVVLRHGKCGRCSSVRSPVALLVFNSHLYFIRSFNQRNKNDIQNDF